MLRGREEGGRTAVGRREIGTERERGRGIIFKKTSYTPYK
jgi:hypothetical protein